MSRKVEGQMSKQVHWGRGWQPTLKGLSPPRPGALCPPLGHTLAGAHGGLSANLALCWPWINSEAQTLYPPSDPVLSYFSEP